MGAQQILVVDDEPAMRQLIRLYLESEFSVLEAPSGREALDLLRQEAPSLVLLDVMMPNLDGWATLRAIREESAVPVVMLTALGDTPDRIQGLRLGADDYIAKPFNGRELVARVKAVLRRAYRTQYKVERVVIGDLTVFPEGRIAQWREQTLSLTPKEFDLLLLLANHAGQTMPRERLLARVWGADYSGGIRTVDTHIKNLREKLNDNGSLIVTVWGIGYRLSDADQETRS